MAKFPKEALKSVVLYEGSNPDHDIEFVESSSWVSEGKYDYRDLVFKHDGKFYMITESRTGSYFTEYYYAYEDWPDEIECDEVTKVPRVTYEWRIVDKNTSTQTTGGNTASEQSNVT